VRVLRTVYPEVCDAAHGDEHMLVGAPPRALSNVAARSGVNGDPANAGGVVLWLGASAEDVRLVAVLSPVDGLITGEHAHRWLEEGVRVYVESEYEALRVAGALGWPIDELQVRASKAPRSV